MQACLQEVFWTLDPPKTWVSSHFSKKNERITNVFEDCESAKHVAIWYQRGQNTFWPQHHFNYSAWLEASSVAASSVAASSVAASVFSSASAVSWSAAYASLTSAIRSFPPLFAQSSQASCRPCSSITPQIYCVLASDRMLSRSAPYLE